MLTIAALPGCGRPAAPPLEGAAIGGAFTLTDQDGRRVSDADFAGRYRLVYFGYTFCPDVCPTALQKLSQGLARLEARDPEAAARIQPIFITVDPERDTPDVVKTYVAAFHPRLIGLTGSPQEIAAVQKRFGIYASKAPVAAGASGYLVDHISQPILFGPKGEPIAPIAEDGSADQIADELARWVR